MRTTGYTHYWRVKENASVDLLVEVGEDMRQIVMAVEERGNPKLAGPSGSATEAPMYGNWGQQKAGFVAFNGVNSESHEAFIWDPEIMGKGMLPGYAITDEPGWGFWFCKTAQKPYDVVVVACLLAAETILGRDLIKITSDASDWEEFVGATQSDGWKAVNSLLGHPTHVHHAENAVQLYERVFKRQPPRPAAFGTADSGEVKYGNERTGDPGWVK